MKLGFYCIYKLLSYLNIRQFLTKFLSTPLRTLFSLRTTQKYVTPTEVTWLQISSNNTVKFRDVQCGNKPVRGLNYTCNLKKCDRSKKWWPYIFPTQNLTSSNDKKYTWKFCCTWISQVRFGQVMVEVDQVHLSVNMNGSGHDGFGWATSL
jgi:hypothetical protein